MEVFGIIIFVILIYIFCKPKTEYRKSRKFGEGLFQDCDTKNFDNNYIDNRE